MDRQLSQEEIDAVLKRAKGPNAPTTGPRYIPFDFQRPDRIAKSQLRALHSLHETFIRNMASSLSAYLRTYVTANLISVEQLSFKELLTGLAAPTCLASLSLDPYDGNAVIEIGPSLVFPMLEIILGGTAKTGAQQRREITEIEQQLLDTLLRLILNDLREAWKSVAPIKFRVETIATDPQLVQILSPNEVVVSITIEMRVGESTGTLTLAIPAINIKMVGHHFEQHGVLRKSDPTEVEQARVLKLLRTSNVTLESQLIGPRLKVRDLLDLQVGDCLGFDHRLEKPVDCLVNGVAKFQGQVVDAGNRRAFSITQVPVAEKAPPRTNEPQ